MAQAKQNMMRGALFFALALVFQSLRLLLPLPPFAGMFLVGSLVNLALILAVWYAGLFPAAAMSILLPIVAFVQGQLAIPLLIPVVMVGNLTLVGCCALWKGRWLWLLPVLKTAILLAGSFFVVQCFAIPVKLAGTILAVMSWPQLITAAIGLLLARQIDRKLPFRRA